MGTSDDKMIIRMLDATIHDNNKDFNIIETRPEHKETYQLDNRMVDNILGLTCKDDGGHTTLLIQNC